MEPNVKYVGKDPLKDPWAQLRKKPGVMVKDTARRTP